MSTTNPVAPCDFVVFGGTVAYERLLMDVVQGNSTLFMRRDEVEAAWAWVEPMLVGWQQSERVPRRYPAGTSGPTDATTLIERDRHTWHEGVTP